MKVNPINTNQNLSFNANIKPTKELQDGFLKVEKCVNSGIMKNMNYAKDFLDSIVRIDQSSKISNFKIEIDKLRPEHTYTKINGRRICGGHNETQRNLQEDYLVVEGVKKYASKLEEIEPSVLDVLKEQVEEAERALDEIKTRYGERLKAELEQAQKFIFKNEK